MGSEWVGGVLLVSICREKIVFDAAVTTTTDVAAQFSVGFKHIPRSRCFACSALS